MEMTSQEVRATGFRVVKKGYDPDEVDAFKDRVAGAVEQAQGQAAARVRSRTMAEDTLFSARPELREHQPLAARLRPTRLEDVVGLSEHLQPGRPLNRLLTGKSVPSVVLHGPPGSGKTTIATLIANFDENAGLRPGDRVVAVSGRAVDHPTEINFAFWGMFVGDEASVDFEGTLDGKTEKGVATVIRIAGLWYLQGTTNR